MLPESSREKSVMLAKAMGWEVYPSGKCIKSPDGGILRDYDDICNSMLYASANMALAWRVHIWATGVHIVGVGYTDWWYEELPWYESDAQAAWLDKILTLAIEAGLVEVS